MREGKKEKKKERERERESDKKHRDIERASQTDTGRLKREEREPQRD